MRKRNDGDDDDVMFKGRMTAVDARNMSLRVQEEKDSKHPSVCAAVKEIDKAVRNGGFRCKFMFEDADGLGIPLSRWCEAKGFGLQFVRRSSDGFIEVVITW